ncbi:YbaB/EbfC family DNA-binding protein [Mycolicibacterium pulveris]|uniref:Secretion protein EspD n=1 Tax=Mycolicibacterium pulveris TaxID=36813 RepID=A0A7I7UK87_MYCPV|nr:YbaB/EbfC family DNA-binding protein [Mycolicibacterium pulveris]MCV6979496.1 YbaB/EbfC family DNA-binding protein [Mycolicibacterium pulveris]BBY81059.1 hypothetical protein MPUL_22170 [Mycolicibacterium pulveris]
MTDNHPHGADDLAAALDFSVPDEASTGSDRDARDEQVFTAANPDRSVTVTALSDSRVKHIELSPKVAAMTEAVLAEEIVVVAGLAAQEAKAAQYVYILEEMRTRGHDDAATRDFLTRDLELPTPQQVRAERERIFATRYAGGHG